MSKAVNYFISDLECPVCGRAFPIPRLSGCKRGANHIKDIWCPYCKKTRKFIENRNVKF